LTATTYDGNDCNICKKFKPHFEPPKQMDDGDHKIWYPGSKIEAQDLTNYTNSIQNPLGKRVAKKGAK